LKEELEYLVIKAQKGDLKAYTEIIERFKSMAFGYAYSILKEHHQAQDAAQEAFIEAYEKLGSLVKTESFPSWFKKVVFKQCDRISRKNKGKTFYHLDNDNDLICLELPADMQLEKREMKAELNNIINTFSEEQRITLTLFYIKDYSIKEISDFLEISLSAVKKRLHDIRKKLKERMTVMVKKSIPNLGPKEIFSQEVIQELLNRKMAVDGVNSPLVKQLQRLELF
jgi:RNA polymerase sigma factor (sigma-70 family)